MGIFSSNPARVLPWLYFGSAEAAENKEKLEKLGITHVINATKAVRFFHPGHFVCVGAGRGTSIVVQCDKDKNSVRRPAVVSRHAPLLPPPALSHTRLNINPLSRYMRLRIEDDEEMGEAQFIKAMRGAAKLLDTIQSKGVCCQPKLNTRMETDLGLERPGSSSVRTQ